MQIFFESKTIIGMSKQTTHYVVGSNLLENLDKILKRENAGYSSFLILADAKAFNLFGKVITTSLKRLDKPVVVSTILSNEQNKNLDKVTEIVKPFFQHGFNRNACVVAIGGGMVTDLGGFIASILLRGIGSIYIPTTLLGQVDASIGGKTGVNFGTNDIIYKNMIGTFKQPAWVISDIDTLSTLSEKEWISGFGEIVKYWVGWGKPAVKELTLIRSILGSTPGVELAEIIGICQEIKINIVKEDPFEKTGVRQKLNLGHTLGHAIEGALGGKLSHGQAVAIGLAAVAWISIKKKMLAEDIYQQILNTLATFGLPTKIIASRYSITRSDLVSAVNEALKLDKKGGPFVLIRDIGQLETDIKVDPVLVEKVLKEIIV